MKKFVDALGDACPIPVVHGVPMASDKPFALTLTFDRNGGASAIVFEKV